MFPLSKLSSKVLFAIFLGTCLNLAAVSYFAFSFTKSIVEQSIMSNQLEIARQTMDKIDRLLNERILNVQDIAGADPLENILTAGNIATEAVQKNALRRLNDYTVVTGPWDLLMLVDREGRIVLSSDETQLGKSVNDQPQNKIAHETSLHEEFYYSDLEISQNTKHPSVIFSAPLYNDRVPGRPVVGTVIGHYSWPAVLQVLEDVSGRALLVNRAGALIGQNGGTNEDLFTRSAPESIEAALRQGRSKSVVLKKEESILGVEALASFTPQSGYLSYRGSDWGLILERPASLAFAPAGKAAFRLVIFLIPVIIAGAFIMMLMINHWVTKPVAILMRTTQEIAGGDLAKRVQIASKDEMGQLAVSFNAMTEKLQGSYQELEEKVSQRTAELEKSEQKNRLVVETANDAFIAIDDTSVITEWNRRAEEIFGWKKTEALGKHLHEKIIPPQYRAAHQEGLKKYLQTGQGPVLNKQIELQALHRDGHEFPIEITIWPVRLGEEVNFNAFVRDISERKRLEGMVLQSEKMSAIGQLAAGVAHEINNPLGVILGFAQYVVKRIQPGDAFEMPMKSIEREAVRCKGLVQDLLLFSRVGKAEKEFLNPIEAVESALSLVLAQTKVKNVEFEKELEDVPPLMANRIQLQQIIVNLCNNAVDAMPDGGRLVVRMKKSKWDDRDCVELQIQDTGQGIAPEIRAKIFNPFFTTKEIGKGTGLGLSLVFEIVQKHEGRILFDTEVGKGTTFRVLLPVPPK